MFRITLAAAISMFLSGTALAQGPLRPAPVSAVTDRYFGTPVEDPYRGLERIDAPDTQQWMKAAAAHAESTLAQLPGRATMLARIVQLQAGSKTQIGRVIRLAGELYVYESRGVADNQYKIVMRRGLSGAELTLVDPQTRAAAVGAKSMAVNYFSASPDGRYLAYGLSEGGSEEAALHLLDMRSSQPVGDPVSRANFGVARWAPDSKSFAFNRLAESGADPKTRYRGSAAWLFTLDGGLAKARELLGPGTRSVAVKPGETPTVLFTTDGRWLIGLLEDGVRREPRVVVAPAASLSQAEPAWSLRIDAEDQIVDFAYAQGQLYATSYRDAPRYKIIAAPIGTFAAATAPTLVAASERVLGTMGAARDALYFEAREGNAKQLWRLPYGAQAKARQVPLPLQGTFSMRQRGGVWAANAQLDGLVLTLESWTQASQIYRVAADGRVSNTGLQPTAPLMRPATSRPAKCWCPATTAPRCPCPSSTRRV